MTADPGSIAGRPRSVTDTTHSHTSIDDGEENEARPRVAAKEK